MQPNRNHRPSGYTLMELLVSSALATVLVAGTASSIYIASQALGIENNAEAVRVRNSRSVDQMLRDLRGARYFSQRTANAVTFTVPDRDGDDRAETISYAWSGTPGDPLTCAYNAEAPAALIADVQDVDFAYQTRTMPAAPLAPTVQFMGFAEAKRANAGQTLDVAAPANLAAGDLLIACLAVDDDPGGVAPPAGWTEIDLGVNNGKITFGVWWKLAAASEPGSYQFAWGANRQAYGWIMRFVGHNAAAPIDVVTTDAGDVSNPTSSSVTCSQDRTLVLRLAGFEQGDVVDDLPGLAGHVGITADRSSGASGNVSGAAGFRIQPSAGASGASTFLLDSKRKYRSVTIAVTPANPS